MSEYIIIRSCKSKTAWYRNKIGHVYKLLDNGYFDHCHTVKISRRKGYADIGTVDLDEAQEITEEIKSTIIFQNIIVITTIIITIILKLFI